MWLRSNLSVVEYTATLSVTSSVVWLDGIISTVVPSPPDSEILRHPLSGIALKVLLREARRVRRCMEEAILPSIIGLGQILHVAQYAHVRRGWFSLAALESSSTGSVGTGIVRIG